MFGIKNVTRGEGNEGVLPKGTATSASGRRVGRTGLSRIEEELLVARSQEEDEIESWRVFKIIAELVSGFELLRHYDLAATVFGSSRCEAGNDVYENAEALAAKPAHAGVAGITGGGHGVMQAANKGAKEAGGESVGLN